MDCNERDHLDRNAGNVFEALTSPGHLNKWFTNGAMVDLREGGRYSNGDGDRGRFLEISRNERLRFTWDNVGHALGTIVEIFLSKKRKEDRPCIDPL